MVAQSGLAVVAIDKHELGLVRGDLVFGHLGKGRNDEQVAHGGVACSRAVDRDHAAAALALDGIGDEALAVVDVPDMDLFVFDQVGGIEQEIGRLAPDARVVLQDIREFMHPLWRWVDERLYWFIAGNLPESFDALFHALQARGNRVPSLAWLSNDYPEDKVRSFLEAQAPDTVLATHYGSAQVLGTLRERGLLAQVNIGWLHTDFFEGYFPRISKRIDRTFLAHPDLESRWLAAGVPPDKVTTSGMPVRAPAADGATRETALTALGLAPDAPTVLITSGKEGIGVNRSSSARRSRVPSLRRLLPRWPSRNSSVSPRTLKPSTRLGGWSRARSRSTSAMRESSATYSS